MIPRYQIVLFLILLLASMILGGVLWHLRERTHERMLAGQDSAPTQAPQVAPMEQATLMVAEDSDDTLETRLLSLPLPPDPSARAKAVLDKLLELYAASDAAHPVPGGTGSIAQVFLLPIGAGSRKAESAAAGASGGGGSAASEAETQTGPQLAVVNLTGKFVGSHPSGLETETLTVLSICATLHANLPRVEQVRFLVDGEPRATLAGHADLTRTYVADDTVTTEASRP